MKKVVLLIVILVVAATMVPAKTTLVNFGYTIQNGFLGNSGINAQSLGLNLVSLNGENLGFYSTFNIYYGLAEESGGTTLYYSDWDILLIGFNTTLGYGVNLNWGNIGLIVGGGLFLDLFYYDWSDTLWTSVGPGLGANFYFKPGLGNLVINAGLGLAWNPWTYGISGSTEYSDMYTDQFNVNINIGVGWSLGGGGGSRQPRASRGGGGSNDGWGDDDW